MADVSGHPLLNEVHQAVNMHMGFKESVVRDISVDVQRISAKES
jgi:hypothetical protein